MTQDDCETAIASQKTLGLFVCLSVRPSVRLSVCLSVRLSVYRAGKVQLHMPWGSTAADRWQTDRPEPSPHNAGQTGKRAIPRAIQQGVQASLGLVDIETLTIKMRYRAAIAKASSNVL